MTATRPPLTPALSGAELRRWYWTLAELTALARTLGVPRGGGKSALVDRLVAALDGTPWSAPPRRAPPGPQLTGSMSAATVIPPGQRCSQVLRRWFEQEIGPGFAFDGAMRAFIAEGTGRTLGEAVAHWHATRAEAARPGPIAAQFELNAFLREWWAAHPGGTRDGALAAWRQRRAAPAPASGAGGTGPAERGRAPAAPD